MNKDNLRSSDLDSYFGRYIKLSPNNDLLEALEYSQNKLIKVLSTLDENKANFRYETNKWSIKELLQHIIDNERIFINRALRIARQDKTKLPAYTHTDYVIPSEADKRNIKDLLAEFKAQRLSSILFFKSLSSKMLKQIGSVGDIDITVLAIGFLIVGHDLHHLNIIEVRYF